MSVADISLSETVALRGSCISYCRLSSRSALILYSGGRPAPPWRLARLSFCDT